MASVFDMNVSGRPSGPPSAENTKKCFSGGELAGGASSFSLGSLTRGPAGEPRGAQSISAVMHGLAAGAAW